VQLLLQFIKARAGKMVKILKEIRAVFSDFIKEYETSTIIKESKYDQMLGLVISSKTIKSF
jgi:hypothetical protein